MYCRYRQTPIRALNAAIHGPSGNRVSDHSSTERAAIFHVFAVRRLLRRDPLWSRGPPGRPARRCRSRRRRRRRAGGWTARSWSTCTVACCDGGTSTSRRPVSLPSIGAGPHDADHRPRRVVPGDGDRHLDGLVVDQLDSRPARPSPRRCPAAARRPAPSATPSAENQHRQPDGDPATGAARQPLPSVAGGGALDHVVLDARRSDRSTELEL